VPVAFRVLIPVLLLAWVPAAAQDLVTPSNRVITHVNIRAATTTDSSDLGDLEIGEGLPLVGDVPFWWEVELPDGGRGFVSKGWTDIAVALQPREEDELRIHFLDVGAGSCTIIECPGPNAAPMIVDCGANGASEADLSANEARDYIQKVLATHTLPPRVVVSHPDTDHYAHIPTVLADTPVDSIWLGGNRAGYGSRGFPAWLAAQEMAGTPVHHGWTPGWHNEGQPITGLACGTAVTFMLTVNTGTSSNAQSMVLMIEHGDFRAILAGDAEGETEEAALANFSGSVDATVVTASHHGADTEGSNSAEWATATSPEVVVYSAGNRFSHPRCNAVERFGSVLEVRRHQLRCGESGGYRPVERSDRAHYMTEMSGAVIATSDGQWPFVLNCTRAAAECGLRISD
jgi:beta-lactamase superfamily II metal-dependent hydrolase